MDPSESLNRTAPAVRDLLRPYAPAIRDGNRSRGDGNRSRARRGARIAARLPAGVIALPAVFGSELHTGIAPNIDRLAGAGLVFENAIAQSSRTPSDGRPLDLRVDDEGVRSKAKALGTIR